ncbi:unnamed protein product [Prunus brigantina]
MSNLPSTTTSLRKMSNLAPNKSQIPIYIRRKPHKNSRCAEILEIRRKSGKPHKNSRCAKMSQISSSSTNPSPSARKLCRCGGYIKTWTSWTDVNHGRRFEACEMSRRNRGNGHH